MTKLKTAIRRLLPRDVTRHIYRWQAKRYVDSLNASRDSTKKTLLVLNHFWEQDIRALANANTEYNLVAIDAPTLFKGAKIHFRNDVQTMNAPYASEDEENRRRWRNECRYIFDLLENRFGVNLIISPSDRFYWIREFINVAHEHRIRTVLLDKEGTLTPQYYKAESARARTNSPYISDHIYVWSERQRRFWNMAGVADEQITVIGQPRSDLFYTEKRFDVDNLVPSVKPLVTFFSYHDDAYIPIDIVQREHVTWCRMKTETHDEIYRLAREYKDYNFVVKAHPQQPDLAELQARYKLDNLRVVGGSSLGNELIQRSELIVAFQTTAVIEAMFLDKRVIYTYWDDLLPRLEDDLLPFHRARGIRVARSASELRRMCAQFLDGDDSLFRFTTEELKARDDFVNTYLFKPDGHVCERFYESIRQSVK